jgi:hypothetical protein
MDGMTARMACMVMTAGMAWMVMTAGMATTAVMVVMAIMAVMGGTVSDTQTNFSDTLTNPVFEYTMARKTHHHINCLSCVSQERSVLLAPRQHGKAPLPV